MEQPHDSTCANKPHSHEACAQSLQGMMDALYVLGGKWKLPIIIALFEKPRRFGELQRVVQGIAAKVLSHELKELEQNGFIKREVYPTTPVTVEYQLLPYAHSLGNVIESLSNWGQNHRLHLGMAAAKSSILQFEGGPKTHEEPSLA
jgi:DNA-binding HxlR family transcriptional regulator